MEPPVWSALSLEEQGFVLGAALLGGRAGSSGAVRGLGGDAAARVGAALEALAALSHDERAAAVAELAAVASQPPLPAALARLEPSWLLGALEGEPADVALALLAGLPARLRGEAERGLRARDAASAAARPLDMNEGARLELQRAIVARLGRLLAEPAGERGRELVALSPSALFDELGRRGARLLGTSLAGAPLEVIARACAAIGEPLAHELRAAARATDGGATRDEARRLAREAEGAASSDFTAADRVRLLGALALREELRPEGLDSVAALASVLPASTGRALLATSPVLRLPWEP